MEISGYEQLKQERIDDVHSDGYLFRHKRAVRVSVYCQMMMKIKCFI